MKKVLFLLLMVWGLQLQAEDNISITVCQPEYDHIPVEAQRVIEDKLDQILTTNGVVSGKSDRFVITAKVTIISRDVMPTNPVKISEKINLTIIIGDGIDNHIFGKTTLPMNGIGVTEVKTQIQAYQRVSPQDEKIKSLVESSKQNIIDYYMNHCSEVLAEADRMDKMGRAKEGITKLLGVPQLCHDCYTQAQSKAMVLYQSIIDDEATQYLKQAQTEWNIKHDYDHAQTAYDYLIKVNPHSSIVSQVDTLADNIAKTLRSQEAAQAVKAQRDWEFKMQQYKDQVEQRKVNTEALKNVGIAFGSHLPQSITKTIMPWGQ